ncbi:hypothetical protein GLAREA_06967 [Glarea lozoyensis ATCC 20868]|uniref:Mid2 domain-containing protein n=1 Tax=Glarea lozoyensis (strain ATCC 20868 / MF5171) TaxID=1116229 RepID=S3D9Z3_GLAL2|nr:uncharacterized protein GLAREA_06967 [Glarea lozoyensis ATCC 20868]EPE33954.1 hypothetical protein GLAREA_06967 [Glarea lozoyensis ATCC 20868]
MQAKAAILTILALTIICAIPGIWADVKKRKKEQESGKGKGSESTSAAGTADGHTSTTIRKEGSERADTIRSSDLPSPLGSSATAGFSGNQDVVVTATGTEVHKSQFMGTQTIGDVATRTSDRSLASGEASVAGRPSLVMSSGDVAGSFESVTTSSEARTEARPTGSSDVRTTVEAASPLPTADDNGVTREDFKVLAATTRSESLPTGSPEIHTSIANDIMPGGSATDEKEMIPSSFKATNIVSSSTESHLTKPAHHHHKSGAKLTSKTTTLPTSNSQDFTSSSSNSTSTPSPSFQHTTVSTSNSNANTRTSGFTDNLHNYNTTYILPSNTILSTSNYRDMEVLTTKIVTITSIKTVVTKNFNIRTTSRRVSKTKTASEISLARITSSGFLNRTNTVTSTSGSEHYDHSRLDELSETKSRQSTRGVNHARNRARDGTSTLSTESGWDTITGIPIDTLELPFTSFLHFSIGPASTSSTSRTRNSRTLGPKTFPTSTSAVLLGLTDSEMASMTTVPRFTLTTTSDVTTTTAEVNVTSVVSVTPAQNTSYLTTLITTTTPGVVPTLAATATGPASKKLGSPVIAGIAAAGVLVLVVVLFFLGKKKGVFGGVVGRDRRSMAQRVEDSRSGLIAGQEYRYIIGGNGR